MLRCMLKASSVSVAMTVIKPNIIHMWLTTQSLTAGCISQCWGGGQDKSMEKRFEPYHFKFKLTPPNVWMKQRCSDVMFPGFKKNDVSSHSELKLRACCVKVAIFSHSRKATCVIWIIRSREMSAHNAHTHTLTHTGSLPDDSSVNRGNTAECNSTLWRLL